MVKVFSGARILTAAAEDFEVGPLIVEDGKIKAFLQLKEIETLCHTAEK